MTGDTLLLRPGDDVAVALRDLDGVPRGVLEVASGRKTVSGEPGFGDEEFAPWQLGAVM